MRTLILMVGIPGSGKSTFAKELMDNAEARYSDGHEYMHICPDDIREELSGDANNQIVSNDAWKFAYDRLETKFKSDEDATIIFDAVLANPRTRKQLVNKAQMWGAQVVYIIMGTPLNVALERNASRKKVVPTHIIQDFDTRMNNEFPFLKKDRCEEIK